jgi:hypothetical protein
MTILTARIAAYMDRYNERQIAKARAAGALHEHTTRDGRRWSIVLRSRWTGAVRWALYDDKPRRVAIGEAPFMKGNSAVLGSWSGTGLALSKAQHEANSRSTR